MYAVTRRIRQLWAWQSRSAAACWS